MSVSLIIPTLNAPTLTNTLSAIVQQTLPPAETIVVGRDQNDTCSQFPEVRFVDTKIPVSAAAARNIGIAEAAHDILLFCDADCIPEQSWVAEHARRHEGGESVVGGSVQVHHSNYWARSDNVSTFHEFVPEQPPGPRFMLPTLNLSVRRAVVHEVGGLDEGYPGAAGEDSDWSIRMRQAGYTLFFEPRACVLHAPSRTTWHDVVRHWRGLGAGGIRVRSRYADEYGTPAIARSPLGLRLLSPAIASVITLRVYRAPGLLRYWSSFPIVFASKVIYCWGAAQALQKVQESWR